MWLSRPLKVIQPGQLSLSSFRGRKMSSKLQGSPLQSVVAPSGERLRGKDAVLAESNGRDDLKSHLRTACTPGSASGPTFDKEYGITLLFTYRVKEMMLIMTVC